LFVTGRNDAKQQTPSIKFTLKADNQHFCPTGAALAPISVKFGTAEGHVGPLGHTKFYINWYMGW